MEFEKGIDSRTDLMIRWDEGCECLYNAINSINESNFDTTIYIRNQKHTIIEALIRQMMRYAYHIGQIVFIGTVLKGKDWKSLSVPKGKSVSFNESKYSKVKHGGHFTDDFL